MSNRQDLGRVDDFEGVFYEALLNVIPTTVQHGHEVLKDQLEGIASQDNFHSVADTTLFGRGGSDKEILWWFGKGYTDHPNPDQRISINPHLAEMNDASPKLQSRKGTLYPSVEAIARVKKHLVPIDLKALAASGDYFKEEGGDFNHGHLIIPFDTTERKKLPQDALRVATIAYAGENGDLDLRIATYQQKNPRADHWKLFTLLPFYAFDYTREGPIALTCGLRFFGSDFNSSFDASGWAFPYAGTMRGVGRAVAAERINYGSIARFLQHPTFDPSKLSGVLNPLGAQALTRVLDDYVSAKR